MRTGLNTANANCCHLLPPHPLTAVGCAATLSTTTTTAKRFRPPPLLASSKTPPSQPKPIKRRKNHLRPKILKTLSKPFPTAPLPEIITPPPPPPPPPPPTVLIPFETPAKDAVSENDVVLGSESKETESVPVPEGTVIGEFNSSGSAGKLFSTRYVLKFCGYFVLVFVFQTICAVMILGNPGFDDEDEKKRKQREAYLRQLDSGVGVLDEVELEMRVNEIRAMARAVRESERRERNNGAGGGESERDIEKEIGERLVKLETKLNSEREKLPNSVIDYLGYGSDDDDGSDGEDHDDLGLKKGVMPLMFKKKFWFKSSGFNKGSGSGSSPKGFGANQSGFRGVNVNGGSKVSSFEGVVPMQNNESELGRDPKGLKKEMRPGNIFLSFLE